MLSFVPLQKSSTPCDFSSSGSFLCIYSISQMACSPKAPSPHQHGYCTVKVEPAWMPLLHSLVNSASSLRGHFVTSNDQTDEGWLRRVGSVADCSVHALNVLRFRDMYFYKVFQLDIWFWDFQSPPSHPCPSVCVPMHSRVYFYLST